MATCGTCKFFTASLNMATPIKMGYCDWIDSHPLPIAYDEPESSRVLAEQVALDCPTFEKKETE